MPNIKPKDISSFQSDIVSEFKKNGDIDVESRVDILIRTVINNKNKEEIPFFLDALKNSIDNGAKLDDLVTTNRNSSIHKNSRNCKYCKRNYNK